MEQSSNNYYPKSERVTRELAHEIASGAHGEPGSAFMTTRELMSYKGVSLKTAHAIMGRLCSESILEVRGRRYHIRAEAVRGVGQRIALLLTRLDTPYFSNLASNLEEHVRAFGAELQIGISHYDSESERRQLARFAAEGVTGILATPWDVTGNAESYGKLSVPWVLIGRTLEGVPADAVLIDNMKAGVAVARHLYERGCREFYYLGQTNLEKDPRLEGYRLGLLDCGCRLPEEHVHRLATPEAGCPRLMRQLAASRVRCGVFCYHDLYAARLITECHEAKLGVPEHVCIAGFDNLPVAAAIYPSLTSVGYPLRDMARMACEILFAKIRCKGPSGGAARYLDTELIVRRSSSPENTNPQDTEA